MKFTYDLHIHSALSPCAENEMTPNNIVNMAVLNGLDVIAVTDHNSAGNIPALEKCAEEKPVLLVPGLEVESVEEVHISCLFPEAQGALAMGELAGKHLMAEVNHKEIFGDQYIFDEKDNIIGEEERLLIVSTDLTVEEVFYHADRLGGYAYFSHVDRNAYSVLSVLGTFPSSLKVAVVEVSDTENGTVFAQERCDLKDKFILYSTDSHRLDQISRGTRCADIPVKGEKLTPYDVIDWLKDKDER